MNEQLKYRVDLLLIKFSARPIFNNYKTTIEMVDRQILKLRQDNQPSTAELVEKELAEFVGKLEELVQEYQQ